MEFELQQFVWHLSSDESEDDVSSTEGSKKSPLLKMIKQDEEHNDIINT